MEAWRGLEAWRLPLGDSGEEEWNKEFWGGGRQEKGNDWTVKKIKVIIKIN